MSLNHRCNKNWLQRFTRSFQLLIYTKLFFITLIFIKIQSFLRPVELIIRQICSKGIYDHVEGGIARYTVDEDWIIPHFEKMLYDNVQFILLLSKFCKIKSETYFKDKLEQTVDTKYLNNEAILINIKLMMPMMEKKALIMFIQP